jgi:hypothetical protein
MATFGRFWPFLARFGRSFWRARGKARAKGQGPRAKSDQRQGLMNETWKLKVEAVGGLPPATRGPRVLPRTGKLVQNRSVFRSVYFPMQWWMHSIDLQLDRCLMVSGNRSKTSSKSVQNRSKTDRNRSGFGAGNWRAFSTALFRTFLHLFAPWSGRARGREGRRGKGKGPRGSSGEFKVQGSTFGVQASRLIRHAGRVWSPGRKKSEAPLAVVDDTNPRIHGGCFGVLGTPLVEARFNWLDLSAGHL